MNKLLQVRTALHGNPKITVVWDQKIYSGPGGDWFGESVDIAVVPNTGMYTAPKLQALMMSLVPGLEPTDINKFWQSPDWLGCGTLYFEEGIGQELLRREVTLTIAGEEGRSDDVFCNGKAVHELTCETQRKIRVHLFPNEQIARAYRRGEFTHRIPSAQLRRYRRMPVSRAVESA